MNTTSRRTRPCKETDWEVGVRKEQIARSQEARRMATKSSHQEAKRPTRTGGQNGCVMKGRAGVGG